MTIKAATVATDAATSNGAARKWGERNMYIGRWPERRKRDTINKAKIQQQDHGDAKTSKKRDVPRHSTSSTNVIFLNAKADHVIIPCGHKTGHRNRPAAAKLEIRLYSQQETSTRHNDISKMLAAGYLSCDGMDLDNDARAAMLPKLSTGASSYPRKTLFPVGASTATDVKVFLTQLKLERYLDAFEDDGFDELDDVMHMTLEEISDIKGMKKGHAKRILRAIKSCLSNTFRPSNPNP